MTGAPAGERVWLYARISEDDHGTEAGVQRQVDDGQALAATRGWHVLEVFVDNDVSALAGRRRPGYADLMTAVAAGGGTRIVVWQTSRLWRNRRERAEGIELLRRAGVSVTAVKGPDLDMSTAYGRGMAGLLGEFDTMESEVKGERVARAALERARLGRANGPVLYGWRRVHTFDDRGRRTGYDDVLDEPAAAIVREITDRVIRRDSLAAITADLTRRGVPPPGATLRFVAKDRAKGNETGLAWGKTTVKKLALRPANAGLRLYHRGLPDERLFDAAWPAIVTREQWEQAVAVLADPARTRERPGSRQHLLTWGIGECGVCGSHLRVATKGAGRHVLYVCDARGCVGRNEARVDDLVTAVALARLARPDAAAWLRSRGDGAAAAARALAEQLRARIALAADAYAAGRISLDALERVDAQVRPELEAAERRSAVSARRSLDGTLEQMAGRAAADAWSSASLGTRRAVLEVLGMTVRILPTRPGPGFDPGSVQVVWRDPSAR